MFPAVSYLGEKEQKRPDFFYDSIENCFPRGTIGLGISHKVEKVL